MRFSFRLQLITMLAMVVAPMVSADAQTDPATALSGPPVSGVCLLSREAIFANAKIGKAASARLKQLSDQAQTRLDQERKPVDADAQTFRSQAASLSADQRQTREQELSQRVQTLQAHTSVVAKQIEATRLKALSRIAEQAQPVINGLYQAKHCGLLLDRNVVLGGNLSNDLTAAVVQGLDAKVGTISFELEPPAPTDGTSPTP